MSRHCKNGNRSFNKSLRATRLGTDEAPQNKDDPRGEKRQVPEEVIWCYRSE